MTETTAEAAVEMIELPLSINASPQLVPYIEQWTGPWAMREIEFNALAETVRKLDLNVHLSSAAAAAARASDLGDMAAYARDENGVATIELRGRMQKQQASLGQSASTVALRRAVRAAAADDQVGAILLIADSPGGTVAGTGELAADIAAAAERKPVIGFAEDVCASACYWALSQATQLFCQPAAAVGSIGTYGVVVDQSMAAAQDGYKVHVVRAGAMKGAGVPGTEVTADQLADFQREINALNELFLAGVAAGREMNIDQVRALATGQVWIGQQAADAGLTDGVASFDKAAGMARAASLTQLKARKKMAAATNPATYAEIVASCIGATPEFICDQLKAGATIDQSVKDWMGHQQKLIEQTRKEGETKAAKIQADADAALAAERAKKAGVDPLPEGSAARREPGAGSALEEFRAAVDEKVTKGMKRSKAVAAVAQENPALQAAVIAEANAGRKAKTA